MRRAPRRSRKGLSFAALGVVTLSLVGCESRNPGFMISIPPPTSWPDQLADQRAQKDRYFKTDPQTPLLAEDVVGFDGLDYWNLDPAYYFVGRVNLYLEPEQFEVVSTSGQLRPCARVGWIGFELDGQMLKLQVYRLLDQQERAGGAGFFLPFMDGTTGDETYPAGRYIELQGPEGGPFVLDFNTASNPWCAYGAPERYACPVTPPENRLPVRIEAGERGFRVKEGAAEAASG